MLNNSIRVLGVNEGSGSIVNQKEQDSPKFYHVESLEGLQEALQNVPCAFGTDWYDSFFDPSECGEVSISQVAKKGRGPSNGAPRSATRNDTTSEQCGNERVRAI